jgi:nicotinamide mononucleotide (NMN) deamidase PncC
MSVVNAEGDSKVERFNFEGNREEVRLQTTKAALLALLEAL